MLSSCLLPGVEGPASEHRPRFRLVTTVVDKDLEVWGISDAPSLIHPY